MTNQYTVRQARPDEYGAIGQLLVQVYSAIEGFPKADTQPGYYNLLANIGRLAEKEGTELLVATNATEQVGGAVVYFNNMAAYGPGTPVQHIQNTSGFRLLAVNPAARGNGIGQLLTNACIARARALGHEQVIIHSTESMHVARKMYAKLGFEPAPAFDFNQKGLPVFGFRLAL